MTTMKSYTALPLDDDLIHEVLCYLPTFKDLGAAIQACKPIFNVYKTHPHAILLRVARNCVGPLGTALTTIRLEAQFDEVDEDDPPSTAGIEEHDEDTLHSADISDLAKLGVLAQQWEDLFSRRRKDRTSQTSVLSAVESERFRASLYRLMIFHAVFQRNRHRKNNDDDSDFEDDSDDDDEDRADAEAEKLRLLNIDARKYLSHFASPDLLHIREVFEFHNSVWFGLLWKNAASLPPYDQHQNPRELMQGYIDAHKTSDSILAAVPLGYWNNTAIPFKDAFNEVASKRSMESLQAPDLVVHSPSTILDEVFGASDKCKACGAVEGLELWNESSWEYTRGPYPTFFSDLLDRRYRNAPQVSTLEILFGQKTLFYDPPSSSSTSAVVAPSAPPPTAGPSTSPAASNPDPDPDSYCTHTSIIKQIFERYLAGTSYQDLTSTDWICIKCLEAIVKSNLPKWIRDWQRDTNQPKNEDCWYGLWCRTQNHRYAHAQKLNHFCDPTRGEAS